MTKPKEDDDGFAEYCRVFVAAKVDFLMPFEERVARMLIFDAQERLEKELDFGGKTRLDYTYAKQAAKPSKQQ